MWGQTWTRNLGPAKTAGGLSVMCRAAGRAAARSGDEALALLDRPENRGIDLPLTGVLMPGSMNGVVLAERVRERLPDAAVLITTGYNEELLAEGPRPTPADVLGKSCRRSELADRVRAALNARAKGLERRRAASRGHEGPGHEG